MRRQSKAIQIGTITVGGNAPIVVQSMTKSDTRNTTATIAQIKDLANCGCEIVRVAVLDKVAAKSLRTIKENADIPIIADIHFDYRLALAALEANIDGLRLNPGNIRNPEQISKVVQAAKQRQVPIRIGINAGSLPPSTEKHQSTAEHMATAAITQIRLLESLNFDLIKISLKAFDVLTTIEAYRMLASMTSYPLHLGITEAGLPETGVIRSAVGIGILLNEGIGDTIRVSLTAHPREEIKAAYEILKSLNIRQYGPTLVSCPGCGRSEVDILALTESVNTRLKEISEPLKIAVMGCVVNGPGEAKDADVGIACGKGKGVIFRKGELISTVEETNFVNALMAEINRLLAV